MNVSFIFINSWTYLQTIREVQEESSNTYLSSLDIISKRTSWRVRSLEPRLETRSSSVTSDQEVAERMRLLLSEDMVEKGVPERSDCAEPCMDGDAVLTDAFALALVEATSVLEDEAPVDARGFSPCAA